jgi:hypothetical protein
MCQETLAVPFAMRSRGRSLGIPPWWNAGTSEMAATCPSLSFRHEKLPLELVCYFSDCFLSRRLNFFDLRFPLIVEGRHCLNSAAILFTAPERYWREWNRMPPGFDEISFLKKKPILFGRLSLNGSYVNQAGELVVGYPSADYLFDHFSALERDFD